MKYGKMAIVDDYGIVTLPDECEDWINEPPPRKWKPGGRVHKERIKARTAAITECIKTLMSIAWKRGNDAATVEAALRALVLKPRD